MTTDDVRDALTAGDFDRSLGIDRPTVARRTGRVVRCDERTGRGLCDAVLDEHGNCPNAGSHEDRP